MENRPIMSLSFSSPAPGADAVALERQRKWRVEVYHPMNMKVRGTVGVDEYQIVRRNPQYPELGILVHYRNLEEWKGYAVSPEGIAIRKEVDLLRREVLEGIWSVAYALLKSFRSKPAFSASNQDTRIENVAIMHLEAYRLSPEEQEKYVKWFNEYACPIFMPLFMKLPGVMGYDWYEDTGLRRRQAREVDYPKYLSLIYLEDINAYENFIISPELAGFQKAMRSVFPRGLKYEWYVQYQLVKSWRK